MFSLLDLSAAFDVIGDGTFLESLYSLGTEKIWAVNSPFHLCQMKPW